MDSKFVIIKYLAIMFHNCLKFKKKIHLKKLRRFLYPSPSPAHPYLPLSKNSNVLNNVVNAIFDIPRQESSCEKATFIGIPPFNEIV